MIIKKIFEYTEDDFGILALSGQNIYQEVT